MFSQACVIPSVPSVPGICLEEVCPGRWGGVSYKWGVSKGV